MADTVAPYRHPDDGHRRHGKRLSIENGGNHLAAVPFYFLLVVGHTLSGRPISAAFSLKTPNTDIQDDVRVALMGDYTYRPFAKPGFENLVTVRDFKVSRTYYKDIRIAEELIYYFNLFESKEENGDTCYYKIENDTKKLVCLINKSDYPFMHLLYSQLLVCQRVCLQNTVCLICK